MKTNGWAIKTLGDICEFQRGLTYAKADEVNVSNNVVLRATNIDLATNLLNLDELRFISGKVEVPASKKVKEGSLLVCTASGSKSHLGKIAYIDQDYGYAFGGFMGMITPTNLLFPRFLFHLMTSDDYKDFIDALSDGANINNLKFDDLKRFKVPLPPLAEQRRIVAILDEAFAGITIAKANAEKNLCNAKNLFKSELQAIFAKRGDGWIESTIGEICTLRSGATLSPSLERPTGDIPYLKVADMNLSENVDGIITSSRFVMRNERAISKKMILPGGTVIFPKRGGAIATNKKRLLRTDICADLNIMGVIPGEQIVPWLLYLYFMNVDLTSFGSGSSIPQVNNYDIAPLRISFPQKRTEQTKIADHLTRLQADAQHLEFLYQQKLAALEMLKKSLLHRAFTGSLE